MMILLFVVRVFCRETEVKNQKKRIVCKHKKKQKSKKKILSSSFSKNHRHRKRSKKSRTKKKLSDVMKRQKE